jgi:hypothetical protein
MRGIELWNLEYSDIKINQNDADIMIKESKTEKSHYLHHFKSGHYFRTFRKGKLIVSNLGILQNTILQKF